MEDLFALTLFVLVHTVSSMYSMLTQLDLVLKTKDLCLGQHGGATGSTIESKKDAGSSLGWIG